MSNRIKNKGYKTPRTKGYKNRYATKKVDTAQDKALKTLTKKVARLEAEPEVKYLWNSDLATVGVPAGDIYFALNIAQGDDFNQRVGEEVMLKKEEWIVEVIMPVSTSSVRYRVIHFMDVQTDGNNPALLTSTSLAAGLLDNSVITDTQYSPINPRCTERYKVYSDKSYIFNRIDSGSAERHVIRTSKAYNTKIKYATSGATVAALPSKCSWIAVFVDSATLVGTYNVYSKTYFTDS